ncbi:MAG: DUF1963 domain-containing protein [Gemmataceae bacterium]|nr:DUF1963 domain-containing protein [Gemmataceae bacterium]
MRYHPAFDAHAWRRKHPTTALERQKFCDYFGISSPGSVAAIEEVRREIVDLGISLVRPVPVDLCVWNWGDSKDRRTTKIGGLPFWPKRCRWPLKSDIDPDSGEHVPLTFVGQICFADSGEIVPKRPGDILVLLACGDDYVETIGLWFDLDDEPLLEANRIPKSGVNLTPLHASLYRTVEYADGPLDELKQKGFPYELPLFRHITSTKIGGISPGLESQSKYLATLHSPEGTRQKHPFIGLPDGQKLTKKERDGVLEIADCGGLSLFRDGKSVHVILSTG